MNKLQQRNNTNLISIIVITLMGIVLWIVAASLVSWLVLSDHLSEPTAAVAAVLVQGVIAYVIAIISYLTQSGKGFLKPMIAPLAYLIVQIIVTMLFWEATIYGMLKAAVSAICGAFLALLTYGFGKNKKKNRSGLRRSR